MQLFVIALVLGIFLADGHNDAVVAVNDWQLAVIVILPKLLLLGAYALHTRLVLRRFGTGAGVGAMRWLQSAGIAYRWLLLASFGQDLACGLLWRTRAAFGSAPGESGPILLDELLVMAPPLLTLIAMWWCFYPIDRRMREASVMRELDEGKPIYRIWSCREYLISQIRHGIAFLLAPLMLIMAITELAQSNTITTLNQEITIPGNIDLQTLIILAGTVCVFLCAPLLIRLIWDTQPVPAGDLRTMLIDMCKRHRIGVRELLVWHTYGAMINAAVIGMFAPVRYILLTDALLDAMPKAHVEAVMAHEIAHVRRRHMRWMMLIAVALLLGFQAFWVQFAKLVYSAGFIQSANAETAVNGVDTTTKLGEGPETVAAFMAVISWLFAFGWVSRRFERQADTFAVQHLTQVLAERRAEETSVKTKQIELEEQQTLPVDPRAVATMTSALGEVAALNHMPAKRTGLAAKLFDWLPDSSVWRHGSIGWRQKYLFTLVGKPVDQLPIDQQIRWIKNAGAVLLILVIAAQMMLD